MRQKSLNLISKAADHSADGTPSADQLVLINKFTARTFEANELYVRRYIVAHNAVDRDNEQFSKSALNDFADSLPGKGVFKNHPNRYDSNAIGVGIWFNAETVQKTHAQIREITGLDLDFGDEKEGLLLYADLYMPRSKGRFKEDIAAMDAGLYRHISIGFNSKSVFVNDRIVWTSPAEALEASIVWLGAQPGAELQKQPTQPNNQPNETMDSDAIAAMKKQLKDKIDAVQALQAELTEKATELESLKTEIVELGGIDQIKAMVTAGNEAKSTMIADIITIMRNSGTCGDSDDEIKKASTDLEMQTVPGLKTLLATLQKTASPQGAAPSTIQHGQGTPPPASNGRRDSSITQKSLGRG